MERRQSKYERLTGSGRKTAGLLMSTGPSCSLWLARDHLLSVDSTGFTERYRRFFYRDIQTITLQRSARGRALTAIYGSLFALTLLLTFLTSDDVWWTFWIVLDFVLFVPLGVNVALGPTCVCFIRTSVQSDELPSMNRLRLARKALAKLTPRIEAAQVSLPPLAERRDDPEVIASLTASDAATPSSKQEHRSARHTRFAFHWVLFIGLISQGVGAFLILARENIVSAGFMLTALVIASVGGVAAVVMQRRSRQRGLLPLLSMGATAGCLALMATAYAFYTASVMAHGSDSGNFGENFAAGQNVAKQLGYFLGTCSDPNTPFLPETLTVLLIVSVLTGGLGILLLVRQRQASHQANAIPPPIPAQSSSSPRVPRTSVAKPVPPPPPSKSQPSAEEE